jgi:hypothetical protein
VGVRGYRNLWVIMSIHRSSALSIQGEAFGVRDGNLEFRGDVQAVEAKGVTGIKRMLSDRSTTCGRDEALGSGWRSRPV